jgi:hypothetical protein
VLEKLIDTWLVSASERSYQAPFCQMLAGEGHIVVHSTRHMAIEFGKDIITVAPDGVPCAFQLKGHPRSRMTLNDLRKIREQLIELATQPIVHPGVTTDIRHRCYLVTNGETDEEVHRSLDDLNRTLERQGFGQNRIQLWSRGQLYDMAVRLGSALWPSEIEDLDLLLGLMVHRGDDLFPVLKFHELLTKLLSLSVDSPRLGEAELKRRITSSALLTAVALRNFSLTENHFAAITAWVMFVTYSIAAGDRHERAYERVAKQSVEIAEAAIYGHLSLLCQEANTNPRLISCIGLEIGAMHKARATLITSLLAVYWLWSEQIGWQNASHRDFIYNWMSHDLADDYLWGEAAVPQFLAHYWYLSKTDPSWRSESQLASLMKTVVVCCSVMPYGKFPGPYFGYEQVAQHHLAHFMGAEDPLADESATNVSFSAEYLLHLLVRANLKQSCKAIWPSFSNLGLKRFEPKERWQSLMLLLPVRSTSCS